MGDAFDSMLLPLPREGLEVPLHREPATLLGQDGLTGPRRGDEAERGGGSTGLSAGGLLAEGIFRGAELFEPDEDKGIPWRVRERSLPFVSCRIPVDTPTEQGDAGARAGRRSSGDPGLLPDDKLSVSEEIEKSAPSDDGLLEPSPKSID